MTSEGIIINHFIFDLDDCLLKTTEVREAEVTSAMIELKGQLAIRGVDVPLEQLTADFAQIEEAHPWGSNGRDIIDRLVEKHTSSYGHILNSRVVEASVVAYHECKSQVLNTDAVYSDVLTTLDFLKQNDIDYVLVTEGKNTLPKKQYEKLTRSGLDPYFEDWQVMVRPKNVAKTYTLAADTLGVAPENYSKIAVVDDRSEKLSCPRSLGMTTFRIRRKGGKYAGLPTGKGDVELKNLDEFCLGDAKQGTLFIPLSMDCYCGT